MTDEQINIAIAEACGWRCAKHVAEFNKIHATMCWIKPGADEWQTQELPDYLNDLNAMHEAEKMLTEIQCAFYRQNLQEIITDIPASMYVWHATARQRAEAFLRTINLWKQ